MNTNPLSSIEETKDQFLHPNTGTQNRITTVSIGVGRDAHSADNSTRQETMSSTVTDDYVSFISINQLKKMIVGIVLKQYTGDLYAEKKHGNGILSWSDGRMFTGAFFADKRHGFGVDHTPDISEFKGLYCHDERFGPGMLIYKSLGSADVGLWLSEALIRLLHPHPNISFDIQITDRKSSQSSSTLVPSWYSPQELLTSAFGWNFLMKKKPSMYFCTHIQGENSLVTDYILGNIDRIHETMQEKRAQIDAYLSSIYGTNDEKCLKDKISHERKADIVSPNETFEQQQLFNHVNKFWPLKQRALFPIDDILSSK